MYTVTKYVVRYMCSDNSYMFVTSLIQDIRRTVQLSVSLKQIYFPVPQFYSICLSLIECPVTGAYRASNNWREALICMWVCWPTMYIRSDIVREVAYGLQYLAHFAKY